MKVLLFADDVVIWGKDQMEVQEQLDIINEKIEQRGLKINVEKSKTVVMNRGEKEGKGVIKVGDKELEVVKHFKYLGSELTEDGRLNLEISRRIQLGSAFYQQVRGLVWNKDIPMKAKEVMYEAYYVPIMTYAAETWTMTQRDESRVQAAEMKFLRSMVQKTRRDRVRNEDIRKELGVQKLNDKLEQNRLRWFGHVKRMNEVRLPRQAMEGRMSGKRGRGRRRMRWMDSVKNSIRKWNLDWNDRTKWRGTIFTPTRCQLEKGK